MFVLFFTFRFILCLDESGEVHESSSRKSFRLVKTTCIAEILEIKPPSSGQTTVPFANVNEALPNMNTEKLDQVKKTTKICVIFV